MSSTKLARRWRGAGTLTAALLVSAAIIYRETLISLADIWLRSDTFAHGMVIFPLVAWLVWRNRAELARVSPRPSLPGAVLLALVVFGWLMGQLADVLVVQQLAVVAIVPAVVWMSLGASALLRMAFPMAFLFFAVPFGEVLIPSLMEVTASFTVFALNLTGIPVYRDGLYFSIPSGDFEVATACSGIRYLMASVALGSLYAYLNYHAWWRRAAFIALSVVVPILANGLRAYGIVMIAHLSDMRLATGVDHLIYGWLFFGLVMFLLFWGGMAFTDSPVGEAQSEERPGGTDARFWTALCATAVAGLGLLAAAPVATTWVLAREADEPLTAPTLPAANDAWRGPLAPAIDWTPDFRGADQSLLGRYERDGRTVHLAVAYYASQEQGAELVNSENRVYAKSWRRIAQGRHDLSGHGVAPGRVVATRVDAQGRRILLWHWYLIDRRTTVSEPVVKLYEAWETLRAGPPAVALVAVAAVDDEEGRDAASVLEDFVAQNGAQIITCVMGGDCE